MKYLGSKRRFRPYILPILQNIIDIHRVKYYIEPFVGGANIIDSIICKKRIGIDNNIYLIELLKAQQSGKIGKKKSKEIALPPNLFRQHYNDVRNTYNILKGKRIPVGEIEKYNIENLLKLYPLWYIGAIGFFGSRSGRFFDGGYAKNVGYRDYYNESRRNLINQNLDNIDFICGDYSLEWDYGLYTGAKGERLYYCDPPYFRMNEKYYDRHGLDYDKFWKWVRVKSKDYFVVVSETVAPNDFKPIWIYDMPKSLKPKPDWEIEKLYVYNRGRLYKSLKNKGGLK